MKKIHFKDIITKNGYIKNVVGAKLNIEEGVEDGTKILHIKTTTPSYHLELILDLKDSLKELTTLGDIAVINSAANLNIYPANTKCIIKYLKSAGDIANVTELYHYTKKDIQFEIINLGNGNKYTQLVVVSILYKNDKYVLCSFMIKPSGFIGPKNIGMKDMLNKPNKKK